MLMNKPAKEEMYQIISNEIVVEDEKIKTYGICCSEGETILDISTSLDVVKKMAKLFNDNHLSPIHFDCDLVSDLLC